MSALIKTPANENVLERCCKIAYMHVSRVIEGEGKKFNQGEPVKNEK